MTEVLALRRGEMPSGEEDWILVEAAGSTEYMVHVCTVRAGKQAVSFAYHGPFSDILDALDKANELTKKMGLPVFYTKGLP